jgi:hypothetical protein
MVADTHLSHFNGYIYMGKMSLNMTFRRKVPEGCSSLACISLKWPQVYVLHYPKMRIYQRMWGANSALKILFPLVDFHLDKLLLVGLSLQCVVELGFLTPPKLGLLVVILLLDFQYSTTIHNRSKVDHKTHIRSRMIIIFFPCHMASRHQVNSR